MLMNHLAGPNQARLRLAVIECSRKAGGERVKFTRLICLGDHQIPVFCAQLKQFSATQTRRGGSDKRLPKIANTLIDGSYRSVLIVDEGTSVKVLASFQAGYFDDIRVAGAKIAEVISKFMGSSPAEPWI